MLTLLLSIAVYLIGILLIAIVIMQRKEASATLAWLLIILTVPLVGVILYLWFGVARVERRVRMRQRRDRTLKPQFQEIDSALHDFKILEERTYDQPVQSQLIAMSRVMPTLDITEGNSFTLYTDADTYIEKLIGTIQDASDSIHLEVYIFLKDETGRMIRDHLIAAARRGVEVRVLVDGIGSWSLGKSFVKSMVDAGVQFAKYLPVTYFGRPWHVNLRNHRKIAIVDGVTAFFGSKNIEDTARSTRGKTLRFCEYAFSCEGPIVQELQEVFAGDWYFATQENLFEDRYFPMPLRRGSGIGQVVTSGPDEQDRTLYEMICSAIHAARDRICITTPYLIPDQALRVALRTAALQGVQVQIITSHRSPNIQERIARIAGMSYYEQLMKAGIEIYEYVPGFMHAKSIVIDGCFASVGTANMDIRSFRLNFEINLNFFSPEITNAVQEAFEEKLLSSRRIELDDFRRRSPGKKLLENSLRTLSPIL